MGALPIGNLESLEVKLQGLIHLGEPWLPYKFNPTWYGLIDICHTTLLFVFFVQQHRKNIYKSMLS